MKNILLNIAFFLLALTKDLNTASADNLRAPEAEGPTQTDDSDGLTIHVENGQVHRKLKGKGKGKGDGTQRCQDISGDWLVLDPLTTYYNDGRPIVQGNAVFRFSQAEPNTSCNYFGLQYFVNIIDGTDEIPFLGNIGLALTTFPGYLGAMEGDEQFLSLAGPPRYAPGNVQVCKNGNTAKIYRDALCVENGATVCTSKNVMYMVRFPEPVEIVNKTYSQLANELGTQLARQADIDSYQFC
ncbi:hypothetical protein TrCOL_g4784 [Triparma columacea]|uniref:Uncharacterized protein n=1 Tax=Triparma columacea TaxID=722753 RepID=A0A9W7GEQ7_9STRA|nr:hypothetical protein TrCOL_g4784 [Triparma columacea]